MHVLYTQLKFSINVIYEEKRNAVILLKKHNKYGKNVMVGTSVLPMFLKSSNNISASSWAKTENGFKLKTGFDFRRSVLFG